MFPMSSLECLSTARFSSLDASMDVNPIIPSLLAWDICLKFVQYKDTWLDFFITDLRHSVHGLATVMYSRKPQ